MIQIYTIAYNRPEFIKYQYESLVYLMENKFEYIVINNANNDAMINEINNVCQNLNVKCIVATGSKRFANPIGFSHINGLNFAYIEILKSNPKYFMIIDHDMFLYNSFNIHDIIDGYILAGVRQNRGEIYYLWPGFIIGDFEKMPNKQDWDLDGMLYITDVGGKLYPYLKDNNITPNYIAEDRLVVKGVDVTLVGKKFFHFINGSNWANLDRNKLNNDHSILLAEIESNYKSNRSRTYWEERYEHNLLHHSTQNQQISTDFLKFVDEHEDFVKLFNNSKSLIEIGCGSGELCSFINKKFSEFNDIVGLDISAHSIKYANDHFKNDVVSFEMRNILIDNITEKYDLALTSNTLEHFKDPYKMIDSMLKFANCVCILVPYNQPNTDGYDSEGGAGHVFQFTLESFDRYEIVSHFKFKTAGWQHSSCGEDPLQLVVLLKNKN